MAKTKDQILVEIYDAETMRIITEYLTAKQNRRADLERKDHDRKGHLRKIAERRCA